MRVVIVEDQVLLRAGLERLFADGGHEVVASRGDASRLLEAEGHEVVATVARPEHVNGAVTTGRPDVVILDIRMPPTFTDEGARAAKAVKDAHPDIGVLVLS